MQGYAYLAYQKWASLYARLNRLKDAKACERKARELQQRFLERFWLPDKRMIALALDGDKRPVATPTSNMGQVLWSGILPQDVANTVIDRLLEDDLFSGFGIRTLAAGIPAYNPLSYHRGSVWPHDNAIILLGMAEYGRKDAVARIFYGLWRAAQGFDRMRLPELFGGFGIDESPEPVPYPVSCSPQAWAAATPIAAVQALLGLKPDVPAGVVRLRPTLPRHVDHIRVRRVHIGNGLLDLSIKRETNGQYAICIDANTTGLAIVLDTP